GGIFVAPAATASEPKASVAIDDRLIMLGATLILWIIGALMLRARSTAPGVAIAGELLLVAVTGITGWRTFRRGFLSAMRKRIDMHVLMSVAAIGALLLREWAEASMLMWLFGVAMWLESWNLGRARRAVQLFSARQPARVRVWNDGTWDQVPIERVGPGARVMVRPGELVPLDGVVVLGEAAVDEAAVTGESQPTHKEPGATLFAGTYCTNGMLEYLVTHGPQQSTVARIRDLVLEAQSSRAPMQGLVDRFAARYTPIVMGIALVIAVVPSLVFLAANPGALPAAKGAVIQEWLTKGLAALVLACPCALVISTPVAFIAALGQGAKRGILIKGGKILEAAAQLKALAFDKTGTLTVGRPVLSEIRPIAVSQVDLLRLALTLETHATHPLAIAVGRYAAQEGLTPLPGLTGFRQAGGKGVEGMIGRTPVALGAISFLLERGVQVDAAGVTLLHEAERWGATLVGVASNSRLIGLLGFRDPVRPEAREALLALRSLGIERLEMLTGDNQAVANALAKDLPLDGVHANLLPQDKQQLLVPMEQRYGVVGMVGDGLNDAPALGRAAVGIAMGERGVDVALETADVVLIGEDLRKTGELIQLARQTQQVIQQNIIIALVVKAAFLVAIAIGAEGLWLAVLGDMGASLLVTTNSLRLVRR
ncbi:MAG: cation-translocating P-type ATPase, partial [bacterium]